MKTTKISFIIAVRLERSSRRQTLPGFQYVRQGGDGTTQNGPLPCPARSADRVNPPRAELYTKFNPPTLSELRKTAIPHNFFPMLLTVGKTPPLPRSNHFKAKKAGPKPQTPYPFISTSKSNPRRSVRRPRQNILIQGQPKGLPPLLLILPHSRKEAGFRH
jgi:hypothetical protein